MNIKDIVDYVKKEINFSREFCEDNVFVTLRIEPIERIIENLEQKDKDNLSYAEDLAKAEAKANKYDSLVDKLEETIDFAKTSKDLITKIKIETLENVLKILKGEKE